MVDIILLENGDSLLQETGDFILLEIQVVLPSITSKIYELNIAPYDNQLISKDDVIQLKQEGGIKLR